MISFSRLDLYVCWVSAAPCAVHPAAVHPDTGDGFAPMGHRHGSAPGRRHRVGPPARDRSGTPGVRNGCDSERVVTFRFWSFPVPASAPWEKDSRRKDDRSRPTFPTHHVAGSPPPESPSRVSPLNLTGPGRTAPHSDLPGLGSAVHPPDSPSPPGVSPVASLCSAAGTGRRARRCAKHTRPPPPADRVDLRSCIRQDGDGAGCEPGSVLRAGGA